MKVLYTETEKTIIRDCREMGFTNKEIASFLNKKEHNNEQIRTSEGVRKQR